MAELVLQAELGRELGSSATRRLRRENKIPGVLYGLGDEPVSVAVAYGELRAALSTDAGLNQLINLDLGGDKALSIVRSHPDVCDVQVDGSKVMIEFAHPDTNPSTLLKSLVDSDVEVITFGRKEPNLEDVFMMVTKGLVS